MNIGDTVNLCGEIIAENTNLDTITIEFNCVDSTVKNKITLTKDEYLRNRLNHLERTINNVDELLDKKDTMLEQGKVER